MSNLGWATAVAVLASAGVLLRVAGLEADPGYYLWPGYIIDEGRWNESARSLVLFGELISSDLNAMHLALSPLYQAAEVVSFSTFGVGLWSARLFSAVSGALLILLPVYFLRRHLGWLPLALTASWLAFDVSLLTMSRIAVPEVPSLMVLTVAYLVTLLYRARLAGPLLGGVVFAAACGIKGTVLLMLPGFLLAAAVSAQPLSLMAGVQRAGWFLLGVVTPALLGYLVLAGFGVLPADRLSAVMGALAEFVELASTYGTVSRIYYGDVAVLINVLLVCVWYLAGAWMCRKDRPNGIVGATFRASAAWLVWSLLLALLLSYWPSRYLVQSTVPAAILLGSGAALGLFDVKWLAARLTEPASRLVELVRVAYLAVPAGAVLAAIAASVASAADLMVLDRLLDNLAFSAVFVVVTAAFCYLNRRRPGVVAALLVLPIAVCVSWLLLEGLGLVGQFWDLGGAAAIIGWIAALGAGLAVLLWLGRRRSGYSAAFLGLLLIPFATLMKYEFDYTYDQLEAAVALAPLVEGDDLVLSDGATSLFLENTARYTEEWKRPGIEAVVTYHRACCERELNRLAGAFELVATHHIPLGPWHHERALITLHRKVSGETP